MRSPIARRGRSKSPSRIRQRSSLSRSKSRSRSRSPRSQPRHGGRYKCEPPKYPPYTCYRIIPDLSKRYADLYIPPEFCRAGAGWLDSLPDHKPLSLVQPVDFQVKKVGIHTLQVPLHGAYQLASSCRTCGARLFRVLLPFSKTTSRGKC